MKQLSLGFSPCPNDTFIFDALIHGKIEHSYDFNIQLADVEELNNLAFKSTFDITKLSFHAWAYMMDDYQMLPSGAALGFGVGPLLISKRPLDLKELESGTIAIPGKWTTANFLMRYNYPTCINKKEYLFSDIEQAVLNDECVAGVIIHENRFTYHQRGLSLIQDLGQAWENQTNMAIPLGGIAIKRSLSEPIKAEIAQLIRKSIHFSSENPASATNYIQEHAQEMAPDVIQKHIDLYVNTYSLDLAEEGRTAISKMLESLQETKLITDIPPQAILAS
ncbi:UNVERIFIED_CONTAM: hypothetical protein GTU68_057595 [Idotea baltica]|nr:hypothetical protein [Idotea baltica]